MKLRTILALSKDSVHSEIRFKASAPVPFSLDCEFKLESDWVIDAKGMIDIEWIE